MVSSLTDSIVKGKIADTCPPIEILSVTSYAGVSDKSISFRILGEIISIEDIGQIGGPDRSISFFTTSSAEIAKFDLLNKLLLRGEIDQKQFDKLDRETPRYFFKIEESNFRVLNIGKYVNAERFDFCKYESRVLPGQAGPPPGGQRSPF